MDKIKSLLHLGAEKGEEKAEQKAEQHGHSTGSHSTGSNSDELSGHHRVPASGGTYEPATTSDSLNTGTHSSHATSSGIESSSSEYGATRGQGIMSHVPGTEAHHEHQTQGGLTGDNHGSFGTSTGLGSGANYETSTSNTGLTSSSNYGTSTSTSGLSGQTGTTGYGSSTSGTGYGSSTGETIASYIPGTQAHQQSTGGDYSSSTTTGLGSGSSGLTGSSLPDRSVGATGSSGNFGGSGDIYHRNETLAHHGPHTTLTARILDPAAGDAPSGIFSPADPYLTTGGVASTTTTTHHQSSTLGSSSGGLGESTQGYSTSGTSGSYDPYGSSGSRDQMSSSNMTSTSGSHHHHDQDSSSKSGGGMLENLKEKVGMGASSTSGSQSGSHSTSHGNHGSSMGMGNDSSRDTGMSGFSTGNPNQGGDTRVPTEEFGNTSSGGNYGSSNYGSSGRGLGDETKYNHSSGQQSTLSSLEQKLAGHSTAPNTNQHGSSTLGRAEQAIDSRVDGTRAGSGVARESDVGSHSVVGGY